VSLQQKRKVRVQQAGRASGACCQDPARLTGGCGDVYSPCESGVSIENIASARATIVVDGASFFIRDAM
jgi:hypothetical protein